MGSAGKAICLEECAVVGFARDRFEIPSALLADGGP